MTMFAVNEVVAPSQDGGKLRPYWQMVMKDLTMPITSVITMSLMKTERWLPAIDGVSADCKQQSSLFAENPPALMITRYLLVFRADVNIRCRRSMFRNGSDINIIICCQRAAAICAYDDYLPKAGNQHPV